MDEFERLGANEKLTYLSDAMDELQRAKLQIHGWDSLFTQPQQQQQPQSKESSEPPKSD